MKNYTELFDKEFSVSQQIDNTFAKICYEQSYAKGFEYLKSLDCKLLDYNSYIILYTIDKLTKKTTKKEEITKLFTKLSKQEDVLDIKMENNNKFKAPQLIVKRPDYEVKVMKFSEILPIAKEILPDLEDDRRQGTCFAKAYDISLHLGVSNDIVTGYCYGYTDKSKFLHSWIETKLKGEDVVIDGPLNAVFNKEGYYKLRHIEELTRISNKTLENDIEKYLQYFKTISPEVYYVFRDEIIKDFEKNENLFNK